MVQITFPDLSLLSCKSIKASAIAAAAQGLINVLSNPSTAELANPKPRALTLLLVERDIDEVETDGRFVTPKDNGYQNSLPILLLTFPLALSLRTKELNIPKMNQK